MPCSWTGRINSYKVHTTQSNLWIQCNPYQNFNGIFHRTRINNAKVCIFSHKRPWIAKGILRKESGAGGVTFSDLKLYYKVIAIKTVSYWHKNRYVDEWKCKSKSQLDIISHLLERLSSKRKEVTREPLSTIFGNVSWYSHCGKQYADSLKNQNRTTTWPNNPTSGYLSEEN